jgi:hypothetical protein
MIVLTLIFCTLAQPVHCQKVSPQEYQSGIACLLEAQQKAAEWGNEHPGWRLAAFRCGPREKQA